jgi:hypothetical protein
VNSLNDITRGSLTVVHIANPGAGNEVAYAVPASFRIEPLSIRFDVITSAVAANRYIMITYNEPAGQALYTCPPVVAQTAGQTRHYNASKTAAPNTIVYPNALQLNLPPDFILNQLYTINTLTDGLDAGDTIINIWLTYLRVAMEL